MFENSEDLASTAKILITGPSASGKTYPALHMPGPIAVLDGEDGVRAYKNRFSFLRTPFFGIDDLNEKLGKITADRKLMESFQTILIDGVTTAWHAALGDVTNNGQIQMSDQAKLKAGFKDLNDRIFTLGKLDRNVVVNAQAKNDWEIKKGQPPKLKGSKADVDGRIWYAFDYVLYVELLEDGTRQATVLKTRDHDLMPLGSTISDFGPQHLLALVGSPIKKPATQNPEALKLQKRVGALAKELGSESRGGCIPDAVAQQVAAALKAGEPDVEHLGGLLSQLEEIQATAAAAA